jgi:hypothetical protein
MKPCHVTKVNDGERTLFSEERAEHVAFGGNNGLRRLHLALFLDFSSLPSTPILLFAPLISFFC